jgi:hypothetical protein
MPQPNDLSRSLVPLDQDSTISFEDPGPPMGEGVSWPRKPRSIIPHVLVKSRLCIRTSRSILFAYDKCR